MALRGTDQRTLVRSLEAAGIDSVRRSLADGEHGDVGSDEFVIVQSWLAMAIDSEANAVARRAHRIAIIAAVIAAIAATMATIGAIPTIVHLLRHLHYL